MDYTGIKVGIDVASIGKAVGCLTEEFDIIKDENYYCQWLQVTHTKHNLMNNIHITDGTNIQRLNSIDLNHMRLEGYVDGEAEKYCSVGFTAAFTGKVRLAISRYVDVNDSNNSDAFLVRKVQVERGNVPTDWHLSDRDIFDKATALIKEMEGQIKLETTRDIYTLQTNLTKLRNTISVLDNRIQLTATRQDINSLDGRVSKASAELKVQAGLISQKVDVDGVINSINLDKSGATIQANITQLNKNNTKSLTMKNGALNCFELDENNRWIGAFSPALWYQQGTENKFHGMQIGASYYGYFASIGYNNNAINDDTVTDFYDPFIYCAFRPHATWYEGTHLVTKPTFIHEGLYLSKFLTFAPIGEGVAMEPNSMDMNGGSIYRINNIWLDKANAGYERVSTFTMGERYGTLMQGSDNVFLATGRSENPTVHLACMANVGDGTSAVVGFSRWIDGSTYNLPVAKAYRNNSNLDNVEVVNTVEGKKTLVQSNAKTFTNSDNSIFTEHGIDLQEVVYSLVEEVKSLKKMLI